MPMCWNGREKNTYIPCFGHAYSTTMIRDRAIGDSVSHLVDDLWTGLYVSLKNIGLLIL
jgi:hypothetical protein